MSGPFHQRAVCTCGWTGECSFGSLLHLSTPQLGHIKVCPDCGRDKYGMEVKTLRYHEGTWRDTEDKPYNGIEPTPAELKAARWGPIIATGIVLILFLAMAIGVDNIIPR